RLAPPGIDVNTGERLVRIDRHLSEYFLFQTLWTLFKSRFTHELRRNYGAFETQAIIAAWQHLPANVIRPERNKRQHLSSVLSRNEVERDYAYNRALFMRVAQGWYQFNPRLSVRRRLGEEEQWIPIYGMLNLPLISEFAWGNGWDNVWGRIAKYLAMAGLPEHTAPIAAERTLAREEAAEKARVQREAEDRAAQERRREELAALRQREPKRGTPEAKRREIERVRQEIEARKKRGD
ncbi:MAG: hypothetical protein ACYC2E_14325, partial [Sulfuricella sp.]